MLALYTLAALLALAVAAPAGQSDCKPRTMCMDAMQTCGTSIMRYGGCYDTCKPTLKPSKPPCPTATVTKTTSTYSTKPTVTKTTSTYSTKPTVTKTTSTSTKSTSKTCTATVSVCVDSVNECGVWYGGCFPDCQPWPTFSKPKCSTTTTPYLTAPPPPAATATTKFELVPA